MLFLKLLEGCNFGLSCSYKMRGALGDQMIEEEGGGFETKNGGSNKLLETQKTNKTFYTYPRLNKGAKSVKPKRKTFRK
jgi:hypothetical protein